MTIMAKKPTKPALEWVDILGPAREFEAAVTKTRDLGRRVSNLPSVKPGAKEIALLSIFKEEQRFAFDPVMRALKSLSEMEDWSGTYFVADRVESKTFDWRQMPLRHYASFEDFYRRELEAVWGKWVDLQATWADVIAGKTPVVEAEDKIKNRAAAAQKDDAADQANQRPAHKHRDRDVYNNDGDINIRPSGTSRAYALRRLREARPDIHARVLAGELTPHAGMVEAGFRKKPQRMKRSPLERAQRLIGTMTTSDLLALQRAIDEQLDQRARISETHEQHAHR
jgi:hypothetical protein